MSSPQLFFTHHCAPPRTDYRYHTRGKHDQFANSAHGESLDASFRYSNMPRTSPIKFDVFSPKTTIYFFCSLPGLISEGFVYFVCICSMDGKMVATCHGGGLASEAEHDLQPLGHSDRG